MRKKKRMLGAVSLLIGCVMLITSAFANTIGNAGYSDYKDSLKKLLTLGELGSATITTETSVVYDGGILESYTSVFSFNREQQAIMNKNINSYWESESYSVFDGDGRKQIYLNNEDQQYYYWYDNYWRSDFEDNLPFSAEYEEEQVNLIERIADAVIGDLKSYFISSKTDNGKLITFRLENSQVPDLVNLILMFGMAQINRYSYQYELSEIYADEYEVLFDEYREDYEDIITGAAYYGETESLDNIMLKSFSQEIFVKSVDCYAEIDGDGYPVRQTGVITIAGKGEDGKVHTLEYTFTVTISGMNSTDIVIPDAVPEPNRYNYDEPYFEYSDFYNKY